METTQEAACPICRRPLPQAGASCRYCAEQAPGSFHVHPLFLALVLILSVAFGAATVFANRYYQAKQQQLGRMWFGRGQAALAAGQPQPAIQDFRNALYYSHDDPEYRLRLAEALVAANHVREAQSYLITLWQDEPSNSTVNLQLARLAARQGETQVALRYYHGAIYGLWPGGEASARRRETRLELIHFLLRLRDATQADAELIALTPELPRNPAAHTEAGRLFLQTGDQERALQEFEEALRLNPKAASAAQGAGEAAFQMAQYNNAEAYLQRASRLGLHDSQTEELLATTRLVLEWNPYAQRVSSRQKAMRVVQAFRQARQRLQQCAASKGMDLAPGSSPAQAYAGAATPNLASPAAGPQKPNSGLVARLLGKIKPGEAANPTQQPPIALNPSEQAQQLYQQVTQLQPKVRTYRVERDPQLADTVMDVVGQIEKVSAQQCGTPKGADLALLLLSQQAEAR